ncbi:MAG: glycosyltransferase [Opitutus sp.]|nr:glycosyltransferase [Opitutus sp.]
MLHYLWNESLDLLAAIPALVLIGTIGAWRWTMWLAKVIPALCYRPIANNFDCTATVVATVFDEDPALFRRGLESWIANAPDRIIAVIDVTDRACQAVARDYPSVEVIINPAAGKRPALVAGVTACRTEIVVLVDSDVLWEPDVLRLLKMPFSDPVIGGASARAHMIPAGRAANTVRAHGQDARATLATAHASAGQDARATPAPDQTTAQRGTVWERLADIFLDLRYAAEVPATTRWGRAVSCLSGRTSAYRTGLLQCLSEPLLHETFNGQPCLSGDDKRYTTLILERGFKTWHQLNARVYSTFKPDFNGFINQRIRWQRNSFRSDLRALTSRWMWRNPYLALLLVDKHLALFTQLNGPFFFLLVCLYGTPALAVALIAWWHVSRAIKIFLHLRRRPEDAWLLPLFIGITFWLSAVKLYALCTLNRQGWLTRRVTMVDGQPMRLPQAA